VAYQVLHLRSVSTSALDDCIILHRAPCHQVQHGIQAQVRRCDFLLDCEAQGLRLLCAKATCVRDAVMPTMRMSVSS
jgi:hypothetical protein